MSNQTWWYVTRSAGLVAWLTLCLSVMWGLLMSTKLIRSGPKRAWLLGTHRALSSISVIFTILHLLVLIPDSSVPYTFVDFFIPFISERKPMAQALGVLAFFLIIAIELTSIARKKLSNKVWKYVHYTSLLLFFAASAHGFMAGTDAKLLGVILFVVFISEPIFVLLVLRVAIAKGKFTLSDGSKIKKPSLEQVVQSVYRVSNVMPIHKNIDSSNKSFRKFDK